MRNTHVVLVGIVASEGVTHLLGGGLLALGLEGRAGRVTGTLDLVTEVLGGRLLGIGLKGRGMEVNIGSQ